MFLAPSWNVQEYKMAKIQNGLLAAEAAKWGVLTMDESFVNALFDFATKVADDDWGLSHGQLVDEARALLERTYPGDDGSEL
jgi:hypothetical protein